MLKWLALVTALLACGAYDIFQQQTIDKLKRERNAREAEIRPLAAIDAEVEHYRREKDRLQRRIDVINQLKQNQSVPADAVAVIAAAGEDSSAIDSVAVVGRNTIVINGRASSDAEVARLADRMRRAGSQSFRAEWKAGAANHSFTLRLTR